MLIEIGVSCRCKALYSGLITTVGEERYIFLLSFTCNYVVSVRRGFLFLLVLGTGCSILLSYSLDLPYNYFACRPMYSRSMSPDASIMSRELRPMCYVNKHCQYTSILFRLEE